MIYYYSLTWILKSELSFVASLWQEVKRGNLLTFLPFTTLVLDNVIILCIVIVFFWHIIIEGILDLTVLGVNDILGLVFTILQTLFVFWYPRINISCDKLLNKFCLMHLLAINIIIWMRILINESIHEAMGYYAKNSGTIKESDLLINFEISTTFLPAARLVR